MMIARTKLLFTVLAAGLLLSAAVQARTCSLSRVTGLTFGNYFPMQAAPLDVRGRIRIVCRGRALPGEADSYTIRISGVVDPGMFGRRMTAGGNQLAYNLFKDAARTDIWGDGTFGKTPLVSRFGNGLVTVGNHWVYGRIPPLLDPGSGVYNDVVDVTIEF